MPCTYEELVQTLQTKLQIPLTYVLQQPFVKEMLEHTTINGHDAATLVDILIRRLGDVPFDDRETAQKILAEMLEVEPIALNTNLAFDATFNNWQMIKGSILFGRWLSEHTDDEALPLKLIKYCSANDPIERSSLFCQELGKCSNYDEAKALFEAVLQDLANANPDDITSVKKALVDDAARANNKKRLFPADLDWGDRNFAINAEEARGFIGEARRILLIRNIGADTPFGQFLLNAGRDVKVVVETALSMQVKNLADIQGVFYPQLFERFILMFGGNFDVTFDKALNSLLRLDEGTLEEDVINDLKNNIAPSLKNYLVMVSNLPNGLVKSHLRSFDVLQKLCRVDMNPIADQDDMIRKFLKEMIGKNFSSKDDIAAAFNAVFGADVFNGEQEGLIEDFTENYLTKYQQNYIKLITALPDGEFKNKLLANDTFKLLSGRGIKFFSDAWLREKFSEKIAGDPLSDGCSAIALNEVIGVQIFDPGSLSDTDKAALQNFRDIILLPHQKNYLTIVAELPDGDLRTYLKSNAIRKLLVSPQHPRPNGAGNKQDLIKKFLQAIAGKHYTHPNAWTALCDALDINQGSRPRYDATIHNRIMEDFNNRCLTDNQFNYISLLYKITTEGAFKEHLKSDYALPLLSVNGVNGVSEQADLIDKFLVNAAGAPLDNPHCATVLNTVLGSMVFVSPRDDAALRNFRDNFLTPQVKTYLTLVADLPDGAFKNRLKTPEVIRLLSPGGANGVLNKEDLIIKFLARVAGKALPLSEIDCAIELNIVLDRTGRAVFVSARDATALRNFQNDILTPQVKAYLTLVASLPDGAFKNRLKTPEAIQLLSPEGANGVLNKEDLIIKFLAQVAGKALPLSEPDCATALNTVLDRTGRAVFVSPGNNAALQNFRDNILTAQQQDYLTMVAGLPDGPFKNLLKNSSVISRLLASHIYTQQRLNDAFIEIFSRHYPSNLDLNAATANALNFILNLRGTANEIRIPANVNIVNDFLNNALRTEPGKERYIRFISSPAISNRAELLAKFKVAEFVNVLVTHWSRAEIPDARALNTLNAALEGAANEGAVRAALAQCIFGNRGLLELAPVLPLTTPPAITNTVGIAPLLTALNLQDGAVASDVPALRDEATHFASHNVLFADMPVLGKAITDIYNHFTTSGAVAAATAMRSNANLTPANLQTFLTAVADLDLVANAVNVAQVKQALVDLFNNAALGAAAFNGVPLFADLDVVAQIIGEARLQQALGKEFGSLFGVDNQFALAEYKNLCDKIGKAAKNEWRVVLNREIANRVNHKHNAANDADTALIGYLRLHQTLGHDFIENILKTEIKDAAKKVGAWDAETVHSKRNTWHKKLTAFVGKAANKNPAGFRDELVSSHLVDRAPAGLDDDAIKNSIVNLRLQKVLGRELIESFRNADDANLYPAIPQDPAHPHLLLEYLQKLVQNNPLWESNLTRFYEEFKQCSKTGKAIHLAHKLLEYLHINTNALDGDYIEQLKSLIPSNLIQDYRLLQLKQALQEQGLNEIVNRLDNFSAIDKQQLQHCLATQVWPANLAEKVTELRKTLTDLPRGLAVNDAIEEGLAQFFSWIPDPERVHLLRNFLAPAVVKEILTESLCNQFLAQIKQFVGPQVVARIEIVQEFIKKKIASAIDVDDATGAVTINVNNFKAFSGSLLTEKAIALREGLDSAADNNAAKNKLEEFLTDIVLVADKTTAAQKISPNNITKDELTLSAKKAEPNAAIEDPVIAKLLAEYKQANGQPLTLTNKNAHAINAMRRKVSSDIASADTLEKKKQLFTAEIRRLKSNNELSSDFPEQFSGEAWEKYLDTEDFDKISTLLELEDPVLRLFAVNDKSLLQYAAINPTAADPGGRRDPNTLACSVDKINGKLREAPAVLIAPFVPKSYKDAILRGTRLENLFNNNDNGEERCAIDYNRTSAIRTHVKNPALKSSLIDNPGAFKNDITQIRHFGARLTAALADINAYKNYLDTPAFHLGKDNFPELYTEQTYNNSKQVEKYKGLFAELGRLPAGPVGFQLNIDVQTLTNDLHTFDKSDYVKNLTDAQKVLDSADLSAFFMSNSRAELDRANAAKASLGNVQTSLIAIRDELKAEQARYEMIIKRFEEIENEENPVPAHPPASAYFQSQDERKHNIGLIRKLHRELENKVNTEIAPRIAQYYAAIDKAGNHIKALDQGITNTTTILQQPAIVTGQFKQKGIRFDTDNDAFHVEWVGPSKHPIISAMQRKHGQPTSSSASADYIDLTTRPAGVSPDAKPTFVSDGAKTIVTLESDTKMRIHCVPDRGPGKRDKTLLAINDTEYKEDIDEFVRAYRDDQKKGIMDKFKISDPFYNKFAGLTKEQLDEARKFALLTYRLQAPAGIIKVVNIPDKEMGAWIVLLLHILSKRDGGTVKILGGENHGYNDDRLEHAAIAVARMRQNRKKNNNEPCADPQQTIDESRNLAKKLKI